MRKAIAIILACVSAKEKQKVRKNTNKIEMQNRIVGGETSRLGCVCARWIARGHHMHTHTYSPQNTVYFQSPSSRKNRIHHLQFGQHCWVFTFVNYEFVTFP